MNWAIGAVGFSLLGITLIAGQSAGPAGPTAARVSFNRDVRPILTTCFRCHGLDQGSRQANLRLDLRDEALKPRRNGSPIVPGRSADSLIVKRIFETNARLIMPPASIHKELTDAQKETIRRWVDQGAEYEGHWAYQPVQRPPVPVAGVRSPIDAFVRARLAQEGLPPSPPADKRTLIRRVTLDLTGLAPTPAEVDAFIADRAPGAYETLVDRLMASPRYAEKQAIYWLDAVRYADTAGFHGDNPYPVWPYRDYVLRAIRDNKPFDAFTREQLAGDLLPNAGEEQRIASAYNRLNRVSGEGGLQEKEYLAKYGADRVRTVSAVWMGSTLGCAECHNHKFDPFLAKDFYAMKAFFADINETGLARDGNGRNGPEAWGAKLMMPAPDEKRQIDDLDRRIAQARRALADRAATLAGEREPWQTAMLERFGRGELKWKFQRPVEMSAQAATLTVHDDLGVRVGSLLRFKTKPVTNLIVVSGANPDTETYAITLKPGAGTWRSLGLEIARDDTLPGGYVARGGIGAEISEIDASLIGSGSSRTERRLSFVVAAAAGSGRGFDADVTAVNAIDGDLETTWSFGDFGVSASNPFAAFQFDRPITTSPDDSIVIRIRQLSPVRRATLGRFRLALSAGPAWPDDPLAGGTVEDVAVDDSREYLGLPASLVQALQTPDADRAPAPAPGRGGRGRGAEFGPLARVILDYYFQLSSPGLAPLVAEVAKLEAAKAAVQMGVTRVMVSEAMPAPRETRILPRGNWMDDAGAVVEPAIPEFLGTLDTAGPSTLREPQGRPEPGRGTTGSGQGRRATRLDLANWLVSPRNPLTARAYVNRVWRQFFGIGLTSTLGDLGSQGEWPSHPDLLDWLAAEFMQPQFDATGAHAWDMKHLARTIVTSDTYKQSSLTTPQLEEKDPNNRLLARQSRFRLDAEIVHDVALQVSGMLAERFGGPSVRPYQPDGYLAALNYPRRSYSADRGEDLARRGLYTFWQRTFLHPDLLAFDAPTREECVLDRTTSDTPLQSLDLLNDPIYVEAARVFAEHALKEGGATPAQQVSWAFTRTTSRPPDASELKTLLTLHVKSLARFRANPNAASQLIRVGEQPVTSTAAPAALAAMTTVTRAMLNLHEMITRD
jgi:Protein of unknown function (DUF1553)/Protein of unknown function (DUF1549)/Planctomycete cytochrome C